MSPKAFLFLVAAAVPVAITLVACSSGDVTVGSTDQALKKKADGGASGDGKHCSPDGVVFSNGGTTSSGSSAGAVYSVGQTFPSPDGCNTCSCTPHGIACTMMACVADAGPPGVCSYDGKSYGAGDSFPSDDGCNSCSCQANGAVLCTMRACAADAGPPATCTYNGKTYKAGDSFPSSDGCNSCGCEANGGIVCTAMACGI